MNKGDIGMSEVGVDGGPDFDAELDFNQDLQDHKASDFWSRVDARVREVLEEAELEDTPENRDRVFKDAYDDVFEADQENLDLEQESRRLP